MQNENMSEREFRVSENASSPPRAGAGFKKSNPARSAIFFFRHIGRRILNGFWLNNCSGCFQQMYNRASQKSIGVGKLT